MAGFITIDHGAGRARVQHVVDPLQILFVLRPKSEIRRGAHQPDLRAGQMAAAQRRDRLHRRGNAHVRRSPAAGQSAIGTTAAARLSRRRRRYRCRPHRPAGHPRRNAHPQQHRRHNADSRTLRLSALYEVKLALTTIHPIRSYSFSSCIVDIRYCK